MTSALSDRLRDALVDFAWDEWGQMGVFSAPEVRSRWAQDPEAMIVFTLEVGRYDARLFDELLDWLVVNDTLVSTRRLRAMCVDDEDRALVAAATEWVAANRRRGSARSVASAAGTEQPLFHGLRATVREPEPVFARHGFLRGHPTVRRYSAAPDPLAPINLAFRLRRLLGTSARAEVVRVLLTTEASSLSGMRITRGAGYARQNVHEALAALRETGVVTRVTLDINQRYAIDRERWAAFLGLPPEWRPVERDWPELLGALRRTLRFLARYDLEGMSPYLRGSVTRQHLEDVAPALTRAGVTVEPGATVEDAPAGLEATLERALALLVAEPVTLR
jgi:hypothetical protein